MNSSTFLPIAISCLLLCFSSCKNRNRNAQAPTESFETKSSPITGITSANSYQVARSEYDENFVTRYGLLYLSTSDQPFSGRILTIDVGESGEFVYSDEQWKGGRKNGKSSKWFTNGVKMYERSYKEGKWHGTVTRWWPNGQKMYVRGYTNGVRHGKEATWRSDGSPLTEPNTFTENGTTINLGTQSSPTVVPYTQELGPEVDEDGPPSPSSPGSWEDTILDNSGESFLNFNAKNEPSSILDLEESQPESSRSDLTKSGLPNSNGNDQLNDSQELSAESDEELPALPVSVGNGREKELTGLPAIPDFPEESMPIEPPLSGGDADGLPELPELSAESDEGLPALPALDGNDGEEELPGLPAIPDFPEESMPIEPPLSGGDADGLPELPELSAESDEELPALPPLPGGIGGDSLPPLPTDDGGLDDLPPLPPLP